MTGLAVGAAVRVRRAFPPGHVRTPFYTRGKSGRIVALAGRFPDPEALAYGRHGGHLRVLWRVRFTLEELWGTSEGAEDDLVADIFEHWLEPTDG